MPPLKHLLRTLTSASLLALAAMQVQAEKQKTAGELIFEPNPYNDQLQTASDKEAPVILAKRTLFNKCQAGLSMMISASRTVANAAEYGQTVEEAKAGAVFNLLRPMNIDYPFRPEQIAESPANQVPKLAIEIGFANPTLDDAVHNKIANEFWGKCEAMYEDFIEKD